MTNKKNSKIAGGALLLPAILYLLLAFGHKEDGYTITGYIHGKTEGKKVYLKYADTLEYDPLPFDSTVIHNGQFFFKGRLSSPRLLCVSIEQPPVPNRVFQDKVFDLFVENATIAVSADIDSLDVEAATLNGTLSVNVEAVGSPSQTRFMQFYSVKGRMDKDRMRIFDAYIGFLNPDSGAVREGKEVGIRLVREMDSVLAVQKDWVMRYITGQPPSEVLAYAALQAIRLSNITVGDIDRLTREFSTADLRGPLKDFFLRQAALAVNSSVGARAPDFVLTDMEGKGRKLTDFIGKGRYVLVDFWASWCSPCRADLPHLREAFDAYHDKGFDVLSISMDTKKDDWIKAVDEEGLRQKWPQLCDPKAFDGDMAKTYHIMGIPLAILYDPSGRVVTRNLRGSWMDAFLIGKYGDLFKKEAPAPSNLAATPAYTPDNLTVTARIKGLKAGEVVYWHRLSGDHPDSAITTDGGFSFRQYIAPGEGDIYVIRIGKQAMVLGANMLLYLDRGQVDITGDGPLLNDTRLSGSPYARDLTAFDDFLEKDPAIKGSADLYKKAQDLSAKKDTAGINALRPAFERIDSVRAILCRQWITQHPASPISSVILKLYLSNTLKLTEQEKILDGLTAAAKDNIPAKDITHSIAVDKLTGIGSMALDFTQTDTAGKPVSLKDFRGKYVLLDFWASWCVPCRAENPNVVAAYRRFHDKGFTVISVSLDQPGGKDKWLNAIHKDSLTWTQVSDLKFWNNAIAKQYDIHSIPSNLLIDPSGKIVGKNLRGEELDKKLEEIFPSGLSLREALSQGSAAIARPENQKDKAELDSILRPVEEEMKPLSETYEKGQEAYRNAVKDKAPEAVLDSMKERLAVLHDAFEPFQRRSRALSIAFFERHPQSDITAFHLMFYVSSLSLDSLELFYNRLGPVIGQSPVGRYLSGQISKLRAGSPGSMAADFTAPDLLGKPLDLSAFRGKYVILDFWASWCVPCRHSNPHLLELYHKYHAAGLDIIGVSDDDTHPEAWKAAVEKDRIGIWHHVLRGADVSLFQKGIDNPKDISEKFGIHLLPTKILIDKDGKIIGRFMDDDESLDNALAGIFNK
jgi:peroxiredoxin